MGYSKSLKNLPIRISISVRKPEGIEEAEQGMAPVSPAPAPENNESPKKEELLILSFLCRRWTLKEMNAITQEDANLKAEAMEKAKADAKDLAAAEEAGPGMELILARVADRILDVEGFDDFPRDERPIAERFCEYFADDEDFIVREVYMQLQERTFQFLPVELVTRITNIS